MNSKLWIQKVFTMCMTVVLVATSSMVALANDKKTAGEIVVKGTEAATVTVNGEAIKTGRTIFSSSTVSTSEGAGAVINLGKAGRVELAQNTTFVVSFDEAAISGSLTAGSITVLVAASPVTVKTLSGQVQLYPGETASSASYAAEPQTTTNSGGTPWFPFAIIMGGAIAGIILSTRDSEGNRFGGTVQTGVSPTR